MFKHLLVAVVAFPVLQAAQQAEPAYQAANARISADYRSEKQACAPLAAQARNVCLEQTRARRNVARAELEHRHGRHERDQHKVLQARAEAADAVARAQCSDMKGRLQELCIVRSRTVEAQALGGAGPAPPVDGPRPEGVRVQRAVVETHSPAATPFKAISL
jgi:hypothetical protein